VTSVYFRPTFHEDATLCSSTNNPGEFIVIVAVVSALVSIFFYVLK